MLSRRDALAAFGSAATLSLAGCLDVIHAPASYCQFKAVRVTWTYRNRTWADEVLRALGHPGGGGEVRARIAEEFPGLGDGPRRLTASDEVHDQLDRTFGDVDYLLGFCGDAFDYGCRNTTAASREDFNAVQVGDGARVSLVGHEFHVHSVDAADPAAIEGWETAFHLFDFSELHAEHGVPLDD